MADFFDQLLSTVLAKNEEIKNTSSTLRDVFGLQLEAQNEQKLNRQLQILNLEKFNKQLNMQN